jgi:hypothetical protein
MPLSISKWSLDGDFARFARANTNQIFQIRDEDLAVTDAASPGRLNDCIDHLFGLSVTANDFQLDLGQEIDGVFSSAILFFMTLLTAEATHFSDCHPLDSRLGQSVLDLFQFEMADYCFDLLHGLSFLNDLPTWPIDKTLPQNPKQGLGLMRPQDL